MTDPQAVSGEPEYSELEKRALATGRRFMDSPEGKLLAKTLADQMAQVRSEVTGTGGVDPGISPRLLAYLTANPFALSRRFTDI